MVVVLQSVCVPDTMRVTCPWHLKSHVPLALQKSCAPGTSKDLCPWHLKICSHIHSPHEQSSQCRSVDHLGWYLKSPLHPGIQSFPGWVVHSCPLLEVISLLLFLLRTVLIVLPLTMMSHDVNWEESSSNTHNCGDA